LESEERGARCATLLPVITRERAQNAKDVL
jgi:hypothetical protein